MKTGKFIAQYKILHERHCFPGRSLASHVPAIGELIVASKAKTLLDYGCGEGLQYKVERFHEAWGTNMPKLYDPAVPGIDTLPASITYDGVICTDVLEHIPEDELDAVIDDLVHYSRKWAYVSVCCRLANRKFDDGTNCHVTVKPFSWWEKKLYKKFDHAKRHLELKESE